jgi:FkbH-like protein
LASKYDELVADFSFLARAKAILVDFDNTLWRGVMADDVDIVHDFHGQSLLKELREAGVLLVALSKADPSGVRWGELHIDRSDFVLEKINWRPKPDNVAEAVEQLGLSPSAFVLIDDNPAERALVTENVPGVQAMDPADPATWRALRNWLQFPSTSQTQEARRRTEMYREGAARRDAVDASHDYGDMMASLSLRYSFRQAAAADMDRLLELIQRTNQFNTTTRRRTKAEIEELLSSSTHRIYVASLGDRFGDLGVVAVVIYDLESATFDSVIMSCRAMGFGLELALICESLKRHREGDVFGLFQPTERNSPAARLFANAGFTEVVPGRWVLPADAVGPDLPSWF